MILENSIKANELLILAKRLNGGLSQIKSSKTDDDYDLGFKEGKRMALQEIHDSVIRRLEVLLKEES